ncbi:MAG: ArsR family transcriptional regulator [Desulfurococcaceae archaeon]
MNRRERFLSTPLHRLIMELVLERPEGAGESELLEALQKEGLDVSKGELYAELMKLELQGYVHVEPIGKELKIRASPKLSEVLGG